MTAKQPTIICTDAEKGLVKCEATFEFPFFYLTFYTSGNKKFNTILLTSAKWYLQALHFTKFEYEQH